MRNKFLTTNFVQQFDCQLAKLRTIMGVRHGALTVSTGWRTLLCDSGRERVISRKSKTRKKSKCEQYRKICS